MRAFEYAPGMRQPINSAARTHRQAQKHKLYIKRYAPGYALYIYIYTIWTTIRAGMRQGMRLDKFHIKSDTTGPYTKLQGTGFWQMTIYYYDA